MPWPVMSQTLCAVALASGFARAQGRRTLDTNNFLRSRERDLRLR